LLIRSFVALRGVPLGFDPHGVAVFRMTPGERYSTTAALWQFEQQSLERIRSLPGVEAAATAMSVPLEPIPDFSAEILGSQQHIEVHTKYLTASPDFFRVLRVPLERGRLFAENDTGSSAKVAIINQAMARRAFAGRDPLGEQIVIDAAGSAREDGPRQIVGIVGDMHEMEPKLAPDIAVFVPRAQTPDSVTGVANHVLPMAWVTRSSGPQEPIEREVQRAVLAVDAQQPISTPHSLDSVVAERTARSQFNLVMMSLFAAVAALLAAIGIHGVVSYQVARRARELGIRMALGATRSHILRIVMAQAMAPVAAGLIVGVAAAFALSRLMQSMLFGVTPRDPATMTAIPIAMAAVALLSCLIPAQRAAKIDPTVALREE
jgi:predicted permease